MNRTEVVKKLNNRGFNAQERDVVKNGVVLKGIMIQPEENAGVCISPIIYMDTVEELENRGLMDCCQRKYICGHNNCFTFGSDVFKWKYVLF